MDAHTRVDGATVYGNTTPKPSCGFLTGFERSHGFQKIVVPTRTVVRQTWTVVGATFRAGTPQKRAHDECTVGLAQVPSQRCRYC